MPSPSIDNRFIFRWGLQLEKTNEEVRRNQIAYFIIVEASFAHFLELNS